MLDIKALLAAAAEKIVKEMEQDKLEEEAKQLKRKSEDESKNVAKSSLTSHLWDLNKKKEIKEEIENALKKEDKKKKEAQEKREIMEKNIVKKENDESFIKGLVADYLTKVSPEIGEEFKKEHAITLEEVVAHYQKQQSNKTKPKDPGHANKKHRKTSRKQESSGSAQEKERTRKVHFSEEDDEFMLQQLKAGVSVTQIASCLGRAQPAVHNRIEKLRRNGSDHSRKSFTQEEDQMILDKALDELVKMSDKSLKLLYCLFIITGRSWPRI